MKSKMQNRGGFSLTEAMLVVAILGSIVMIGPTLMTQTSRFFLLSQTRIDLQREARAAIAVITRKLRQAQTNSIRIDAVGGQPYYSRIQFLTIQGSTITYNQSGTHLIQTEGIHTMTLSKNLRYLAFTFPRSDDLGIVSVAMTLEKNLYQGRTKALHMASEKVEVMN